MSNSSGREVSEMHASDVLLGCLTAGAITLSPGVGLAANQGPVAPEASKAAASAAAPKAEAQKSEVRWVHGQVTAVEPGAKTLVVKAMPAKQDLTVGVDVTDKTVIRQGKMRKTLADIKVGDRVRMKYERTDGKLVADIVRILRPTHVAAQR